MLKCYSIKSQLEEPFFFFLTNLNVLTVSIFAEAAKLVPDICTSLPPGYTARLCCPAPLAIRCFHRT